jgi:hypothetical protein
VASMTCSGRNLLPWSSVSVSSMMHSVLVTRILVS